MSTDEEPVGVVVEYVNPEDQWQKYDYYYRSPWRTNEEIREELFEEICPKSKFRSRRKKDQNVMTAAKILEILKSHKSNRARQHAMFGKFGEYELRHRCDLLDYPHLLGMDKYTRLGYSINPKRFGRGKESLTWYGHYRHISESDKVAFTAIGGPEINHAEYNMFPRTGNKNLLKENFEALAIYRSEDDFYEDDHAELLEKFATDQGIPPEDFYIVRDTILLRDKLWVLPATFKGYQCYEITKRNRQKMLTDVIFRKISKNWHKSLKKTIDFE